MSRHRGGISALLGAGLVAWALVVRGPGVAGDLDAAGAAAAAPFPQTGSVAEDFALTVLDLSDPSSLADTLRLSNFRGQWVYLDVFGSWCLPCQQKYPTMRLISEAVQAENGMVLGLLLEDRPADAAAWLSAQEPPTHPFLVLDDETAGAWQLDGAPMGYLIDPEGTIVRRCYGCNRGDDAVEGLVAEIRARRMMREEPGT
jgi:thiol-disulfide isomerase/thioredoxin